MIALIPHAGTARPEAAAWASPLTLPVLGQLLAQLSLTQRDQGLADSLSPPEERALAQLLGLPRGDGLVPWAAWQRQHSGHPPGDSAWAEITPCHWEVRTGHLVMADPANLALGADESAALLASMAPYFAGDGIALHPLAEGGGGGGVRVTRWLAQSPVFAGLACASLARVVGQDINDWMPEAAQAAPLRRLQNEMQMLLYQHPVNDARQARGALPVNSFWISGAGALAPLEAAGPHVAPLTLGSLTRPAQQGDWAAWAQAWQTLDATELPPVLAAAKAGQSVQLVLCGERHAYHFANSPGGAWRRHFQSFFGQIGHKSRYSFISSL